MPDNVLAVDLITYDPLSPTTRKERTALLGVSLLGVALVKVPLVPEKFSLLGIEFAAVQQIAFVRIYALIVAFYLLAFCIYAATDYLSWRRREVITLHEYDHQKRERMKSSAELAKVNLEELLGPKGSDRLTGTSDGDKRLPPYRGMASYWLAHGAVRVRASFEFLLPIAFALYALLVLLNYK